MKCGKGDCTNEAIKRGKYCIIHRTTKRKRDDDTPLPNDVEKLNQELIAKLLQDDEREEEDQRRRRGIGIGEGETESKRSDDQHDERRSLIEEQNLNYIEAERRDRENIARKQQEIDKKIKIRQKHASFIQTPSDIILQFMFPEFCIKVRQPFHNNATLLDLYDFVDMTLEDNNINMTDYYMVIYPNNKFYRENSHEKLNDLNIIHGVSILIQRL